MVVFFVGGGVGFYVNNFMGVEGCGIDLGVRFDNASSDRSGCLGDIE